MARYPYIVNNDTFPNVRASINTGLDSLSTTEPFDGFYNGNFLFWTPTSGALDLGGTPTTYNIPATTTDSRQIAPGWFYFNQGSPALTVSRQNFALGTSTAGMPNPAHFLRISNTGTGSSPQFSCIEHVIPYVSLYSGKRVTVSFWARASYSKTIATQLVQISGTGGQIRLSGALSRVTLTSTWTRYDVSFDVPSVAGWSESASATGRFGFRVYLQAQASDAVAGGTAINWEGSGDVDFAEFRIDTGNYARIPVESRHPYAIALQQRAVEFNATQARRSVFWQPVTASVVEYELVRFDRMRYGFGDTSRISATLTVLNNPSSVSVAIAVRSDDGIVVQFTSPVTQTVLVDYMVRCSVVF